MKEFSHYRFSLFLSTHILYFSSLAPVKIRSVCQIKHLKASSAPPHAFVFINPSPSFSHSFSCKFFLFFFFPFWQQSMIYKAFYQISDKEYRSMDFRRKNKCTFFRAKKSRTLICHKR